MAERDENDGGGAAETREDPLLGRLVAGKYRVVKLVARGGMGRIYLAEQEPLGRAVALKVLDARYVQSDQDPEFQKRFLLEASTCARLTHPNTVKVFDYGRIESLGDETYFMVMEFIEGRTLRQSLKDYGYFPPARALRVTREIARSLREAHRMGVVHRDLKPSNVMLVASDEGESVKVLDFGIVKVVRDDFGDLTVGGRFLGSPRYMSPEVIRHGEIDGRSDVYSLGVLLYEMLCARPPFAGEKSVQTMMSHLNDPVPSIRDRTGIEVAVPVEAVARRCLEKDPRNRFQSVDELIAAIDQVSREMGLDFGAGARSTLSVMPPGAGVASGPAPLTEPSGPSGGTPLGWQTSGHPTGTHTHGALPPGALEPQRERWRLIAFVSMVLTIGVLLILVLRREVGGPSVAPPVPLPATTAPASLAAVTPSEPPRPESAAPAPQATVRLESTPEAAEVVEGDRVLGVTPLTLPIDPAALAQASRRLVLRKDGYTAQTIELGPVPAGTILQRTLARSAGRPTPPRPRPSASPSKPGLDIRTER